jgi:hypothetical protein
LSRRAVHADFAAHELYQTLADGKAQASAAILSGHAVVGLFEGLEQPHLCLRFDADACVAYLEADLHGFGAFSNRADAQGDGTLRGEFYGVANQIEEDLT